MAQRKTRLGQFVDAAARASEQTTQRVHPATVRNVTLLAFLLAAVGVVWGMVSHMPTHVVFGLAAMFLGVVSGWAQLSFIMNKESGAPRTHVVSIVMSVLSILITIAGVVLLFVGVLPASAIVYGSLAGFVMIAAVGLIVAPWWITLIANLGNQEAATAREQVRLDFTARLHDSVLQTLALIQINADDPKKVAALAHAQERDLRDWLYGDAEEDAGASAKSESKSKPEPASAAVTETLSHRLKSTVAEVEDTTECQMETVTVGDMAYSNVLSPLLAAGREAMLNAAHHGSSPYSVYLEVSGNLAQLYVRDHGKGFDAEHLPAGHLGVSESILGRMKRNGGTADIDSRPGWGTEVRLALRVQTEGNHDEEI